MLKSRKGSISTKQGIGIISSIVLTVLGVVAIMWFVLPPGTLQGGGGGLDEGDAYSYVGYGMDHTIYTTSKYAGSDVSATIYFYDEKPDNYENCRSDNLGDYILSGTSTASGGRYFYTFTAEPGTYWARVENSTYYCEFLEFTIPSSGDSTVNDYNAAPQSDRVDLIDIETIDIPVIDFGVATNTTTESTLTKVETISIGTTEGYKLEEVKIKEDATYESFGDDTDGDGTTDEGIKAVTITISGGQAWGGGTATSCEWTPYDDGAAIDEVGADDEAKTDCKLFFPKESLVTIKTELTVWATNDTVGANDESFGDEEDVFNLFFVDAEGNVDNDEVEG